MEIKWSLKELYQSFDDPQFINDLDQLKQNLVELKTYSDQKHEEHYLVDYLHKENETDDLVEKIYAFISLTMSTDTKHRQAIKYASLIETLLASFADSGAAIQKWIGKFDVSQLNHPYIQEHAFILKEMQDHNHYLLDEQSEAVLANMQTTGSSSWEQYKDQLVSAMKVTIDHQDYPLTEVLNMAYSKDRKLRKKSYECEIKSYEKVEQGIASALNAIKGEAMTIANLRGYQSILDRTLKDSRMSQKTLDALMNTVKKSLPLFEKYYQTKAKLLGYDHGLPWYEIYAPITDVSSHYDYEQGGQFVVEQFQTFSQELGDFASKAIKNNWIDVYPREGKVGGAFCNNIHSIQESRFLLNYGNDFSDVITLAHELGHGFHGYCLDQQSSLNSGYPMPIAETASTFCETIVKKAALKNANQDIKLMILESEISDCAQVIVDIYSRFLFESRLIKERENGPLSVEEIKNLMIESQKDAYGNGLDHDYLHPYMWTWKSHYYQVNQAFYNFPYTFGLLLARGLYCLYIEEGETFAKKYENFLSLTGKMNLEDLCMTIGIDIEDEVFWEKSIQSIASDLDVFYDLIEKNEKTSLDK